MVLKRPAEYANIRLLTRAARIRRNIHLNAGYLFESDLKVYSRIRSKECFPSRKVFIHPSIFFSGKCEMPPRAAKFQIHGCGLFSYGLVTITPIHRVLIFFVE